MYKTDKVCPLMYKIKRSLDSDVIYRLSDTVGSVNLKTGDLKVVAGFILTQFQPLVRILVVLDMHISFYLVFRII